MAWVIRFPVWLWWLCCCACGGAAPAAIDDAGMEASIDDAAMDDAAVDAAVDGAVDDGGPVDAAADGVVDDGGPVDAGADDTGVTDAESSDAGTDAGDPCPSYRIGEYMVSGDIPTSCPPGDGETPPRPIVSRAASCVLRVDWDPVAGDRLRLEGELDIMEDGALMGTLEINDVPLGCGGRLLAEPVPDGEIELACGECSVRLRPRTEL